VIETRPSLSLADLEAFDPAARAGGRERRFLCPLPGPCEVKQRGAIHRSLSLNVESGAWHCWRCGAAGQLREKWTPTPRRASALARARRACGLSRPPAVATDVATTIDLEAASRGLRAIEGSTGARYLAGRGIALELAIAASVRWAANWYGRPAVVFPLRDRGGQLVALQGRHTDGRDDPKAHDCGRKSAGVFATPGALEAATVVVTEAPIDALSLATAGVPAVALCGLRLPGWVPKAVAFRKVVVGVDNDRAGDEATPRLVASLAAFGARVERLRPSTKDWNDDLQQLGFDAVRRAVGDDQVDQEHNVNDEPQFTFEVRWARDRGWLEVRDVWSGEWHQVLARVCPAGWRDLAHIERALRQKA
jgi:phage/plasmid primase-like uncharacterized protein